MLRFIRSLVIISSSLALIVVAEKSNQSPPESASSSLAGFVIHLPANSAKSNVSIPTDAKLKYLAIGSGTQNYKCGHTSPQNKTLTWLYQGAVAQMYDVSKDASNAANIANDMMHGKKSGKKLPDITKFPLLGKHYFEMYQDGTAPPTPLPKFDFSIGTHLKGEASYLIAKKIGAIDSPLKGERNIKWLELKTVKGALATTVLRTNTRGGMPPKKECQQNQLLQANYAAVYSFHQ